MLITEIWWFRSAEKWIFIFTQMEMRKCLYRNIKWNIKMFDWIKFSYILWSELFRKLCFQSVCCFFQFAFIFLILTCFITHTPDWNLQMEVNCKITFQKLYSLIKYIYLLLHCMYMYLVYLTFQTMNPKPELGVQHKQM